MYHMTTSRRVGLVLTTILALFFLAPGAGWAQSPLSITPTASGPHKVVIADGLASFTFTHTQGADLQVRFHVNLRPDQSAGGGPGTVNTFFTIHASDPSPETISVPLPVPVLVDGQCWSYVQADVNWTGKPWQHADATGRESTGATCDGPSPSPTPSVTPTPTPTPSVTPTPSATSSVSVTPSVTPKPSPSPSILPALAHTGGEVWALLAALFLLSGGTVAVGLSRRSGRH